MMKRMALFLLMFVACSDANKPSETPAISLRDQYHARAPELPQTQLNWQPENWPVDVTWRIGTLDGTLNNVVRVPFYLDSDGFSTAGGLLFFEYDADKLRVDCAFVDGDLCYPRITPGPIWDGMVSYTFGWVNVAESQVNMLILGWNPEHWGGIGIATHDTPFFYVDFVPIKPGKAHIVWDQLPKNPPNFWRRSECLVFLGPGDHGVIWDVVDYLATEFTGNTTVQPGQVIVRP